MKKILFILFIFVLVGCEDVEQYKEQYINYKKQLSTSSVFTSYEDLPFELDIKLEKNEDLIKYDILIFNPKENLSNIEILVIHDQITSDKYPSIGIFDSMGMLNESSSTLKLSGYFEDQSELEDIIVNFKFIIKYTDSDNKKQVIYYKTTK